MSQTAIGRAALVLTTDASGAKAGLAQFAVDAKKGVADAAAGASAAGGKGGGFLSNLVGSALAGLRGGPMVAAAAVGLQLGTTIFDAITHPFDRLDLFGKISKQSAALGIPASQFQGLSAVMKRAGIEGENVGQVFAQMGKSIQDVASGHGKGAARAFEALGLDAAQLAGMRPDQQLLAIADAFQKLPPGGAQAAAAVQLFGGHAAALLPELQKGSSGIQAFIEQQKKVGAVLSDDQLKAAGEAQKAWKAAKNEISSAWEGLKNRATLIAAPFIQFVGKSVSKLFTLATPFFDWLGRAMEAVADIGTAVFEELTKWVQEAVDWVKQMAGELFGMAGGAPTIREVLVAIFRAVGTAAALTWDTLKAGAGSVAFVFGAILEYGGSTLSMFRQVVDLGRELPEAMRPKGFDNFAAAVAKADDKVRGWGRDARKWGAEAVQNFGQSATKFNSWLDGALHKQKKAAEDVKAEARAAAEEMTELLNVENKSLLKGSQAEITARLKHDLGTDTLPKEVAKNTKKAADHLQNIDGTLKDMKGKSPGPSLAPV